MRTFWVPRIGVHEPSTSAERASDQDDANEVVVGDRDFFDALREWSHEDEPIAHP